MGKKILYIDMDGVIVDFSSAIPKLDPETRARYEDFKDEIPGIFSLMDPMPGAISSVEFLAKHFDFYVLSTSPWNNPSAASGKVNWVRKYLPEVAYKRLILSHHKNLNKGDYIIDDRTARGVDKFEGEHIHFGQKGFENWDKVVSYLVEKEGLTTKHEN